MPFRSKLRTYATPLALLAALSSTQAARAQDLFGRTGRYDLTGSPLIQDLKLDYAYIKGQTPSYAERRGLAGTPNVEVRRNYIYVGDTDGTLKLPYQSQNDLIDSFNFALREVYAVLPDEFVFIYLFTSFETGVGAFFYAPEANTTQGIGSRVYDSNGTSPREGFVFMNDWSFFQFGGPPGLDRAQARSVFNQEAGHRWGSFITLGTAENGTGPDVLLGRDNGHWSYFLQTGGSPMEGNDWLEEGRGRFTTKTTWENWHYSPLDLYLMGLIPSSEVPSFFVIQDPVTTGLEDLTGQPLNAASTPQILRPVTVTGTRHDLTIEEVISRNGRRVPPVGEAPTRFRVAFVMLASQAKPLGEPDRVRFEQMVDDYVQGFEQATGNRAHLDNALNVTPKKPIGGACAQVDECDRQEASMCLVASPVPAGTGLCTHGCATNAACPDTWCCQASGYGSVCLPPTMCKAPDVMPPEPPMPPANDCACDTSSACEQGCACDKACDSATSPAGGTCACDRTYDCDRENESDSEASCPSGPLCACDPECAGKTEADLDKGCCCSTTGSGQAEGFGLLVMLVGLASTLRRRSRR